jgi:hypothetical protein
VRVARRRGATLAGCVEQKCCAAHAEFSGCLGSTVLCCLIVQRE